MGKALTCWRALAAYFERHPAQTLCYLLALVAIVVALAIALGASNESNQNRADIKDLQEVFCSGGASAQDQRNKELCRGLLDALLRDPTPKQAERLREIIKED